MPVIGYGAGGGPAGFDPTLVTAASIVAPSRALRFDLGTRRFVEDGLGGFVDVHPVDQKVVFTLGIEQGALPSVPTLGQRYRARVSGIPPQTIAAVVLDETRTVLASLVSARDIEIVKVDTDATVRGRVLIAVTYRNLRIGTVNKFTTQA